MKGFDLIFILYKMKLLTPRGIKMVFSSIRKYGINLMILLSLARKYGDKRAIVGEEEEITYKQLFTQTETLAGILKSKYHLKNGQKVGILCHNHLSFIKSIFACSTLGLDIYMLNTKMSKEQLQSLLSEHQFDFMIYDFTFHSYFGNHSIEKIPSYHPDLPAINHFLYAKKEKMPFTKPASAGKIKLLTGGTTGKPKVMTHTPSLFTYLSPFLTMLQRLKLLNYHTAYIATPIYHGYGLAILLVFLALGKKVVISETFQAKKANELIDKYKVEVMTVVPLMLQKMLETDLNKLSSLRCIASGSAELSPKLVEETFHQLGPVLYNLYGTSEAGLSTIATPKDLTYSARTIGKKISGVHLSVLDNKKRKVPTSQVGQFCIYRKRQWIEIGDLGYKDERGYYFLCGRIDDMIVSGGINIYPIELEQVLTTHPQVKNAAVIGVTDPVFGQRLKAFVQLEAHAKINKEAFVDWLRPKVATYQVPRDIVFVDHLPYTHLGKLDKKQLYLNEETNSI